MSGELDFDLQAAWLRRFMGDAEGNLRAFALRLKEALPEQVTVAEAHGFFSKAKVTGVTVELGDARYCLAIESGRLKATVAMVVRGITLNTKAMDPADWFTRLTEETRKASDHAQALSASLSAFMAS